MTGLWTALDLSLRGLSVVLLERQNIGGGPSGKLHGLLHSGARYAVTDPEAAVECIRENQLFPKIASHVIEDTGGYFVAVTQEDEAYKEKFVEALKITGIPYKEVSLSEALIEEPELNRNIRSVIEVPDKVVYARDLLISIAFTAFDKGAFIVEKAEVVKIRNESENLIVEVRDILEGSNFEISAKFLVNAAGPWAARVAKAASIDLDIMPTAGTMVVFSKRLIKHVINRMRPPSDGIY